MIETEMFYQQVTALAKRTLPELRGQASQLAALVAHEQNDDSLAALGELAELDEALKVAAQTILAAAFPELVKQKAAA